MAVTLVLPGSVVKLAVKRLSIRPLMLWPGVAEELLGTKAYFVRAGMFKDVDAVIANRLSESGVVKVRGAPPSIRISLQPLCDRIRAAGVAVAEDLKSAMVVVSK